MRSSALKRRDVEQLYASGARHARVTLANDLDLELPTIQSLWERLVFVCYDDQVGQADDVAACRTQEVRVVIGMTMTTSDLEAPCPVPDLFSTKQTYTGEVDEVAIERASIPSKRLQRFDDLSMADRSIGAM